MGSLMAQALPSFSFCLLNLCSMPSQCVDPVGSPLLFLRMLEIFFPASAAAEAGPFVSGVSHVHMLSAVRIGADEFTDGDDFPVVPGFCFFQGLVLVVISTAFIAAEVFLPSF